MLKKIVLSLSVISFINVNCFSQCTLRTTAVASGDTLHCQGGLQYRTAVAFNPTFNLYYSNTSGGSDPDEYFDIDGNYLGSDINTDWRGFWYNPSTGKIEGNCWDNYFVVDNLTTQGFLGGSTQVVFNTTPPDPQAVGVFDPQNNRVLYYKSGSLYGESRVDGVNAPTITLTGIANFSNISSPTLIYTGCAGMEIGLYNYSTKQILFFNKTTGVYSSSISLPSNTPTTTYNSGQFSFANNIVWIFNNTLKKWIGFDIFDSSVGIEEYQTNTVSFFPNPVESTLTLDAKENSEVSIYDVLGKVIIKERLDSKNQINLSNLTPGVYFLQINNEKRAKFIKQ